MSNDYATPIWLMSLFDGWFDPCPLNYSEDGLKIEWKDRTYVNPPYSDPLPWVEKAIEESKKGKKIAMLLKVDPSTRAFKRLFENGGHFLWCAERLHYNEMRGGANFPSMLVIL